MDTVFSIGAVSHVSLLEWHSNLLTTYRQAIYLFVISVIIRRAAIQAIYFLERKKTICRIVPGKGEQQHLAL